MTREPAHSVSKRGRQGEGRPTLYTPELASRLADQVIVLPGEEFDALIGRPGYHLCENGDLERREGSLVYAMVRQGNRALPMGE